MHILHIPSYSWWPCHGGRWHTGLGYVYMPGTGANIAHVIMITCILFCMFCIFNILIVLSTHLEYCVLHLHILHFILHVLHIQHIHDIKSNILHFFSYIYIYIYIYILHIILHVVGVLHIHTAYSAHWCTVHISHIIFKYNFLTVFKLSYNAWHGKTEFQNASCVQSVSEQNTTPKVLLKIRANLICLVQN